MTLLFELAIPYLQLILFDNFLNFFNLRGVVYTYLALRVKRDDTELINTVLRCVTVQAQEFIFA